MGRTVYAEEQIKDFIDILDASGKCNIGMIVGQQNSSSKDHVILLVPTPNSNGGEFKPDAIDEQWISQHSIQVTRMMPGGLNVIGIFVCATPEHLKTLQPKLRQAVFAVQKHMKRKEIVKTADKITERIVVQICAVTKKITCRGVDVADPNSVMKPVDWKFQSSLNKWPLVTSVLHVDLSIPVTMTTGKSALLKKFHNGLAPFLNSIQQSISTVNGELRPGQNPLDKQSKSGKSGKKGSSASGGSRQVYEVNLFNKMVCDNYQVVKSDCSACFHLRGSLQCRAYVNNKATVDNATQALKEDAIRSLQARCDLLVDDLIQNPEDTEGSTTPGFNRATVLPRRVFTPVPGMSIDACDYMFPDESSADCLERFSEILSLDTTTDMLDFTSETVPDIDDLSHDTDNEETIPVDDRNVGRPTSKAGRGTYIAAALSLSGAAVAALMSYLTLAND
ncbi:protein odr-4 homolog [Anneissia japonica]|uniref:protein odr-4 homolog n=1 Tax=Anneissia japonica TaxID=1529436 RepID=UPI001425A06C|nr:protein odr-4 homolog [Anneissia japonica]